MPPTTKVISGILLALAAVWLVLLYHDSDVVPPPAGGVIQPPDSADLEGARRSENAVLRRTGRLEVATPSEEDLYALLLFNGTQTHGAAQKLVRLISSGGLESVEVAGEIFGRLLRDIQDSSPRFVAPSSTYWVLTYNVGPAIGRSPQYAEYARRPTESAAHEELREQLEKFLSAAQQLEFVLNEWANLDPEDLAMYLDQVFDVLGDAAAPYVGFLVEAALDADKNVHADAVMGVLLTRATPDVALRAASMALGNVQARFEHANIDNRVLLCAFRASQLSAVHAKAEEYLNAVLSRDVESSEDPGADVLAILLAGGMEKSPLATQALCAVFDQTQDTRVADMALTNLARVSDVATIVSIGAAHGLHLTKVPVGEEDLALTAALALSLIGSTARRPQDSLLAAQEIEPLLWSWPHEGAYVIRLEQIIRRLESYKMPVLTDVLQELSNSVNARIANAASNTLKTWEGG